MNWFIAGAIVFLVCYVWCVGYYLGLWGKKSKCKKDNDSVKESHNVLTEHEQKLLDDIIKVYPAFINGVEDENDEKNNQIDKENGICSKCGSTKVVNKIKRIKGQIDGETDTDIESSHFLFSGYSRYSSRGSVHGAMDTEGIKHCNDCGNEEYYEAQEELETEDKDILRQIYWGIMFSSDWDEPWGSFCKYLLSEYSFIEFSNVCKYIYYNKEKIPADMEFYNINDDYKYYQNWHNDEDVAKAWAEGVEKIKQENKN